MIFLLQLWIGHTQNKLFKAVADQPEICLRKKMRWLSNRNTPYDKLPISKNNRDVLYLYTHLYWQEEGGRLELSPEFKPPDLLCLHLIADHRRADWLCYWDEFVQKARLKKLACLCHIKQNNLTYLGRVFTPCLSMSTGIYNLIFISVI